MSPQSSRLGRTALPAAVLAERTSAASLESLGFAGLAELIRSETRAHAPHPVVGLDPRTDLPVAYSPARAHRAAAGHCVVCDGETCPAVDLATWPAAARPQRGGTCDVARDGTCDDGVPDDSVPDEGDPDDGEPDVAWLTPNLYPNVFPFEDRGPSAVGHAIRGLHLVQWSSRYHRRGLVGADAGTARVLLGQLARAEEFLLHNAPESYPDTGDGHRGHVGIIKNRGRRVGGSVEHDHQQILLTNVEPAEPGRVTGLGAALLRDAPAELTVDEVDGLATTIVPAFMWRPLHAFVVPSTATRQPETGHLHHLAPDVLDALALAVARLAQAVDAVMGVSGEPAWNLVFHTGHGRGPLIELRPYTQPLGGYEHLGLFMCEELPAVSAGRLREALPRAGTEPR